MKEWRYWLAEQRGTLLALGIFVVMFAIYVINHPAIVNRGFSVSTVGNVVQTAANKGVLLAFVAMAQTLVVLTAGIDLSVGMVFILSQLRRIVSRRRLDAERAARARRACCSSGSRAAP